MAQNRLQELNAAGQSIWLDFIDRTILRNGELQRRIRDEALTGMTSNPSIFEKALAEGTVYDDQIQSASGDFTAMELFELIATSDVRSACDIFAPVFERTNGYDGFVSIEVSPSAANDAKATISEGARLWATVNRPNVMIKVPGTVEGAKAVRQLTADGVNVNITLLFSIDAHKSVIDAYMSGLEDRIAAGKRIDSIHSVASFFVSRVDTEVDKRLDAAKKTSSNPAELDALHGKAAVARHIASPRPPIDRHRRVLAVLEEFLRIDPLRHVHLRVVRGIFAEGSPLAELLGVRDKGPFRVDRGH